MIPEITARGFRTRDIEDIREIPSEHRSPTGRVLSGDRVEQMVSAALKEQPDGGFAAELDGRVLGFAIVIHKERVIVAYLDYMQVKIGHIGSGVGHRLMERCIDWGREKHARIPYIETGRDNERAIRFYQRHNSTSRVASPTTTETD